MKKLLITGGTVFVSRYAAEYFVKMGYSGLYRYNSFYENIRYRRFNIFDKLWKDNLTRRNIYGL